jgi:putative cofactor-binding repeat protein
MSAENGPTPIVCTDKAVYFIGDTLEGALSSWHYGTLDVEVDVYVGLLSSVGVLLMQDQKGNWTPTVTPVIKNLKVDPKIQEVFWVPFIKYKLPAFFPACVNFFLTVVTAAGSQNWASDLNYVPFLIMKPPASIYYVDIKNGFDNALSGKTSNNPWRTITYALNQLGTKNQPVLLKVAKGEYTVPEGENFPLKIPPLVYLRGEGAEVTELNAEGSGAYHVIECDSSLPYSRVEYISTIIEGFHITGGSAIGSTGDNACGGGIFCKNFGTVIIQNNSIGRNEAAENGGGIYISNNIQKSRTIIHHNIIKENKASHGGALFIHDTNPETEIIANTIRENTAVRGAGIYCTSSVAISNNLIEENRAKEFGGGIFSEFGDSSIAGNLIKNNIAKNGSQEGSNSESFANGGGIYIWQESYPTIRNNAIIGNKAIGENAMGGGIFCDLGSGPEILNNTIAKNEAQASNNIDLLLDLALGGQGGGIHCIKGAGAEVKNCAIFENIASHRGGGIRVQCSSPDIINNMIRDNISNGNGGGICCGNSYSDIRNNTIVNNEAPNGEGGGIWSTIQPGGKMPDITDCIIYSNVAISHPEIWTDHPLHPPLYCCIKNWSGTGTGNISYDPMFEQGPFGKYYLKDDIKIKSQCIDAGSQTAPKAGLDNRTSIAKKGSVDTNMVDLGYHYLKC